MINPLSEAGYKVFEEGHEVLEASYGVSEAGWGAREAGYGVSTRRDFPLPAHYSTTPLCRIASTLQSTLDPSRLEEVDKQASSRSKKFPLFFLSEGAQSP